MNHVAWRWDTRDGWTVWSVPPGMGSWNPVDTYVIWLGRGWKDLPRPSCWFTVDSLEIKP